jgi:hypothetical protein
MESTSIHGHQDLPQPDNSFLRCSIDDTVKAGRVKIRTFILLNFTRIITFSDLIVFCVKMVPVGAGQYLEWIEGLTLFTT